MYNYLVTFYNYLVSLFTTPVQAHVETWKDIYETIDPTLAEFAEKLAALDKLFYSSSGSNEQLETMFTDITKEFRTIQQTVLCLKNMPVADDAQRFIRNQKVYDAAKYLQQESTSFNKLQWAYFVAMVNDECNACETTKEALLMANSLHKKIEDNEYKEANNFYYSL
jgi:erythromycin esterase-like protein